MIQQKLIDTFFAGKDIDNQTFYKDMYNVIVHTK